MSDTVTYAIEAGVGLVCAVAAIPLWRSGRRWLGSLLLVAGAAAIAHSAAVLIA